MSEPEQEYYRSGGVLITNTRAELGGGADVRHGEYHGRQHGANAKCPRWMRVTLRDGRRILCSRGAGFPWRAARTIHRAVGTCDRHLLRPWVEEDQPKPRHNFIYLRAD
jgi:hypothetical protein